MWRGNLFFQPKALTYIRAEKAYLSHVSPECGTSAGPGRAFTVTYYEVVRAADDFGCTVHKTATLLEMPIGQ